MGSPPVAPPRRYNSVSDVPVNDCNVLRKVANLTKAEHNSPLSKLQTSKPKYLPEKLDFRMYAKFEGQMLINWFISSIPEEHSIKEAINMQELKTIAAQFCTILLAAGVLKQIEDNNANNQHDGCFRV